jgi:hypothetical protein
VIKYTYSDDTVSYEKSIVLGNQEAKIYHGTLYFKGKNLIKEDRILDDTAPVLFRNTQWILNTILKKILLCYFRI